MATVVAVVGLWQIAVTYHPEHIRWLGERYDNTERSISRLRDLPANQPRQTIVFFGDSTVSQYDHGPSLPILMAQSLNLSKRFPWVKVASVAAPGSGITQNGFLADHIAETRPDVVIWQLSYFQFTDRWTSQNGTPELVGFVHAERLPEILMMPLERFKLSLSDVLLQQAIVRLDLHWVHRRIRKTQLRFGRMRETVEEALNNNTGRRPEKRAQTMRGTGYMRRHFGPVIRNRYSIDGERMHFGETLAGIEPDHAKLRLFRSSVARLVDAGSDVIVYMNPTNFDHLRAIGLEHEAALDLVLQEIERSATESGARFLDLTELLRDEDYEDAAGHFIEDEDQTVPRRVANAIAEEAKPILEARRARAQARAREESL